MQLGYVHLFSALNGLHIQNVTNFSTPEKKKEQNKILNKEPNKESSKDKDVSC